MSDPAGSGHPDVIEAVGDETMHRKQAWKPGERDLAERQVAALEEVAKVLKKTYKAAHPDEPDEEAQPK